MNDFIKTNQFNESINKINKNDKIVFCDIDWTIYRNSLFLDLLYVFIEDWIVPKEKIQKLEELKNAWKNRKNTYDDYVRYGVSEIYEKIITQIDRKYLIKASEKVVENNWSQILTYTLNKLKELQKEGYKIIFISWSPIELVDVFTKKYGFDIWFWTYSKYLENWMFNGEFDILASSKNKILLINYIKSLINPPHVIALWDTNWDYDMLINSDQWYAINPTNELYSKIQNENNINVIIERKDLILELDKNARNNINFY